MSQVINMNCLAIFFLSHLLTSCMHCLHKSHSFIYLFFFFFLPAVGCIAQYVTFGHGVSLDLLRHRDRVHQQLIGELEGHLLNIRGFTQELIVAQA